LTVATVRNVRVDAQRFDETSAVGLAAMKEPAASPYFWKSRAALRRQPWTDPSQDRLLAVTNRSLVVVDGESMQPVSRGALVEQESWPPKMEPPARPVEPLTATPNLPNDLTGSYPTNFLLVSKFRQSTHYKVFCKNEKAAYLGAPHSRG
jgi:hypothetical protein